MITQVLPPRELADYITNHDGYELQAVLEFAAHVDHNLMCSIPCSEAYRMVFENGDLYLVANVDSIVTGDTEMFCQDCNVYLPTIDYEYAC